MNAEFQIFKMTMNVSKWHLCITYYLEKGYSVIFQKKNWVLLNPIFGKESVNHLINIAWRTDRPAKKFFDLA